MTISIDVTLTDLSFSKTSVVNVSGTNEFTRAHRTLKKEDRNHQTKNRYFKNE